MTRRRLLIVALLLGALVGCATHAPAPARALHVVIVSLDGLRPEFYLDEAYEAPELRALLRSEEHRLNSSHVQKSRMPSSA